MNRLAIYSIATFATLLALLGGRAIVAQDDGKSAVRIPDGFAMSDFKGYENWAVISVSQTDGLLKAILGNPAMIAAYQSGSPGNGKPFPDGARMAKIMWLPVTEPKSPSPAHVAGALKHIDFMEKDSKRFASTAGWGYGQFNYNEATGRFTPDGTGTACGAACHKLVAAQDSVFTKYPKR